MAFLTFRRTNVFRTWRDNSSFISRIFPESNNSGFRACPVSTSSNHFWSCDIIFLKSKNESLPIYTKIRAKRHLPITTFVKLFYGPISHLFVVYRLQSRFLPKNYKSPSFYNFRARAVLQPTLVVIKLILSCFNLVPSENDDGKHKDKSLR